MMTSRLLCKKAAAPSSSMGVFSISDETQSAVKQVYLKQLAKGGVVEEYKQHIEDGIRWAIEQKGGGAYLELGPGTCDDLLKVAPLFKSAIGVDHEGDKLLASVEGVPEHVHILQQDLNEGIGVDPNSANIVRIDRVLMHVNNPLDVLKGTLSALKPGGVAFVAMSDWSDFNLHISDKELADVYKEKRLDYMRSPRSVSDIRTYLSKSKYGVMESVYPCFTHNVKGMKTWNRFDQIFEDNPDLMNRKEALEKELKEREAAGQVLSSMTMRVFCIIKPLAETPHSPV